MLNYQRVSAQCPFETTNFLPWWLLLCSLLKNDNPHMNGLNIPFGLNERIHHIYSYNHYPSERSRNIVPSTKWLLNIPMKWLLTILNLCPSTVFWCRSASVLEKKRNRATVPGGVSFGLTPQLWSCTSWLYFEICDYYGYNYGISMAIITTGLWT